MVIGIFSAVLVLLADLLSKHFLYGLPARSVLGNFLWIESRLNEGIAFSFFEGKGYIFAFLGLVACGVFIWLILSKKIFDTKLAKVGLGMLLGGTLGNVIDRLVFGGVRDFIYLKFINYPIFNLADVCIIIGVILICIFVIMVGKKKNPQQKQNSKDQGSADNG